jgi:hypothetical protein
VHFSSSNQTYFSSCSEASAASEEDESSLTRRMRRFAQGKSEPCLDAVKGSLLSAADQMLTTVSEIIIENAQLDKGEAGQFCMFFTRIFISSQNLVNSHCLYTLYTS